MDTFNDTYSKYLGIATRSIQALDPNVRIGITNWAEFDVQFNGFQSSQSLGSGSGAVTAQGAGFGDVVLRTKMNLFGNDDGPVGLAIIPYVKVPSSAPVISNGAVEGGLIVPLALRLPQDYLVTLMTEVDVTDLVRKRSEIRTELVTTYNHCVMRACVLALGEHPRLNAIVTDVKIEGLIAQVEMIVSDPVRRVAVVTRDAVEELELRQGMPVTAIVKSTSVMVQH